MLRKEPQTLLWVVRSPNETQATAGPAQTPLLPAALLGSPEDSGEEAAFIHSAVNERGLDVPG